MAGQDDNPKNNKISNVADLMRQVFISGLPEESKQSEFLIDLSGHYNTEQSEFELGVLSNQPAADGIFSCRKKLAVSR